MATLAVFVLLSVGLALIVMGVAWAVASSGLRPATCEGTIQARRRGVVVTPSPGCRKGYSDGPYS